MYILVQIALFHYFLLLLLLYLLYLVLVPIHIDFLYFGLYLYLYYLLYSRYKGKLLQKNCDDAKIMHKSRRLAISDEYIYYWWHMKIYDSPKVFWRDGYYGNRKYRRAEEEAPHEKERCCRDGDSWGNCHGAWFCGVGSACSEKVPILIRKLRKASIPAFAVTSGWAKSIWQPQIRTAAWAKRITLCESS